MTQQNCRMKLRLSEVAGVAPDVVVDHHEWTVRLNRWPEVGMRVAVTVDVAPSGAPELVDVDWDSVFGEVLGGKLGVAAEYLAGAASVDLDLSRGVDSPGPPPDFQEQIAELNRRHAAGEITYEEMAEGIKRVMRFE
jgi:hypothetical protein